MTSAELERQLRDDAQTLRAVFAGLAALSTRWDDVRGRSEAGKRGYFTPDEEDRLRQLLLAYRNYRHTLYEILNRHLDYEEVPAGPLQLRTFMTAFASALTLYSRSLLFIRAFEHAPLHRRKLNEPDQHLGLPAGFFDEVLAAYSSFHHYRLVLRAQRYWRQHCRAARQQGLGGDSDVNWLVEVIRTERVAVRRCFRDVLVHRIRHDWRSVWATTFAPVRRLGHGLQATLARKLSGLRIATTAPPALDAHALAQLEALLQPGDILLVRANRRLTNALFPGFWKHAAIFAANASPARPATVIEAVAPRVTVHPLARCLHADHVAVFRPRLSSAALTGALTHAFSHLGKPYDFEFDFNVSSRVVCTELVYRSFHGRGGIRFHLTKRLGRYTLTADDIAATFLREHTLAAAAAGDTSLELIALATSSANHTVEILQGLAAVRQLRLLNSRTEPAEPAAADHPALLTHG